MESGRVGMLRCRKEAFVFVFMSLVRGRAWDLRYVLRC